MVDGYSKEEARRLIATITPELLGHSLRLHSWSPISDPYVHNYPPPEVYAQLFTDLNALFTYFREIQPRGRFSLTIFVGRDTAEKKAPAFFIDTQIYEKATS